MRLLLFILIALMSNLSSGQIQFPIHIAESNLKVNPLGEKNFQFGLCQGDTLILNFSEINSSPLDQFTFSIYQGSTIFQDYRITEIINKKIPIHQTEIYQITLKNKSLKKRIGRYKLERIPESQQTKAFNTTVYSKIEKDTTYKVKKKPEIQYKGLKAISVVEQGKFFIHSKTKAFFSSGKSKVVVPFTLPIHTIEWYYQFSSYREEKDIQRVSQSFSLLGKISKVFDKSGATQLGVQLLTQPPGGDICNIYLLDAPNSSAFKTSNSWQYNSNGSRENSVSGIVQSKQLGAQSHYLGIANPDGIYGVHVVLDVVAIVPDVQLGMKEIQKSIVKKRKELYLKN